jgi:hypothetical protein
MKNETRSKLFSGSLCPGKSPSSQFKNITQNRNTMSSGSEIGEHFPLNRNQHVRTRRSFDWSVCKDENRSEDGIGETLSTQSVDSVHDVTRVTRVTRVTCDTRVACDIATTIQRRVRCVRCCNCDSSIAIGQCVYESAFCSQLCLTSWKLARSKRLVLKYGGESAVEEADEIARLESDSDSEAGSERVRHAPIDIPRPSCQSVK